MRRTASQPVVGISCASANTASTEAMIWRVSEAGGSVLLITDHAARNPGVDFERLQGLVVMGNDFDIDPVYYIDRYPEGDPRRIVHPSTKSELENDEARARARYENSIIKLALAAKLPMLCICGGMQRLNVLCGGTLIQHVPDVVGHDKLMQRDHGVPGEVPVIPVVIEPATRLSIIAQKIQMAFITKKTPGLPTVVMENSFRHQSIDMVGDGLRISAKSDVVRMSDGTSRYLIEAIEADPGGPYAEQFLIGVQWHPEFGASEVGRALVKDFLRHARERAV